MNHAITVGEVLTVISIAGGLIAVVGILFFLIWLFNPFRSGH